MHVFTFLPTIESLRLDFNAIELLWNIIKENIKRKKSNDTRRTRACY